MIKATINGTEHLIPETPEELTLGEYISLVDYLEARPEPDGIGLLAHLKGIPEGVLRKVEGKPAIILEEALLQLLSRIGEIEDWIKPKAIPLQILGKEYQPPSWRLSPLWARMKYAALLEEPGPIYGKFAKALAIYFSPLVFSDEPEEHLDEIAADLMEGPARTAVPCACFFLNKPLHLKTSGRMGYSGLMMEILKRRAVIA